MKKYLTALCLLLVVSLSFQSLPPDYAVVEASRSGNLQLFLILGSEELSQKNYLTLDQALQAGKVTVKETGSVNQLSVDNDGDTYVFIHSGDIVKGGKQDRTISQDVIIPPKAKDVALESFCVERGRWRQRGEEAVGHFSQNTAMLSSRDLKLSARYAKSQGQVWSKVAEQQAELSKEVSEQEGRMVEVSSFESATSLQLALENEALNKLKLEKKKRYADLLDSHPRAIGYAYAINGEIYGIDIYNNRQLFVDLWDKLLDAVIVESIAIAEAEGFTPVAPAEVLAFITETHQDSPKPTQSEINASTSLKMVENANMQVMFSTEDKAARQWIHRNYVKRDASLEQQPNLDIRPYRNIENNLPVPQEQRIIRNRRH
jgi:hypothetical protein